MNTLKVPLVEISEEGIEIETTLSADAIRPKDASELALGPVSIRGRLSGGEGIYVFRGTLSGTYQGPCDRCIRDVEWPFTLTVQWTFMESDPAIPDDEWESGLEQEDGSIASTAAYSGVELDLGKQAWEEIVLAMPSKFPPLDASMTRCSVCGEEIAAMLRPEDKEEELTNRGLQGLKEMFPNLPSGPVKE